MADCMLKRFLGRTTGVQHASWPTVIANRIDFAHRHPRVRHHRPRIALRRGQEEGGEFETVFAISFNLSVAAVVTLAPLLIQNRWARLIRAVFTCTYTLWRDPITHREH